MINQLVNAAPVNKEIVTLEEHVKSSEIHKESGSCIRFDYSLNERSTKSKLLKAAKRDPILLEENSTSCNIVFSAGAWFHHVLPSVNYWNEVQGDKTCKIGDYEIMVGGVKAGRENNGKTVNNQIVFYADRSKIVCHLYNTTQLILVNGHGYKKFVDTFLMPFFTTRAQENAKELVQFNDEVITKLAPRTVKRSDIKFKKSSTFTCNFCEFAAKSISTLNKHKANEHTLKQNTSKKVLHPLPLQSTRNNSIVERLMIEDISVTDLSIDNVKNIDEDSLKYTCFQCNYTTTSKTSIDRHVDAKHADEGEEEVKFICIICEHEFDIAEDYDCHVKIHEERSSRTNDNLTDNSVRELSNLVYCHILDHQVQLMSTDSEGDLPEIELQPNALQQCNQCDHTASNKTNLNTHIQIKHKAVEVVLKPVSTFRCKMCPYECNLNIKMKKHIHKEHADSTPVKCDLCEFQAHLINDMWSHKLETHTGEDIDARPKDRNEDKDRTMSFIVEQNIKLMGEVLDMKKFFKDILKQFTYDVEDHINKVKEETKKQNESTANGLSILGKEILKLREGVKDEVGPVKAVSEPLYKEPERSTPNSKLTEPYVSIVSAPPSVNNSSKDTSPKITKKKSRYQQKPRILMVGDSLLHKTNFRHLERATQSTIRTAKGYSSARDNDIKFKNPNITDITKTELEKAHYDQLVLAAPTNDISNIDTSCIAPSDNTEHLKVKVRESCLNIFALAEHAIDNHDIDQVIVMNHAPRHDTTEDDPVKIKHNLALFANAHMQELWLASPFKHKIVIGEHISSVKSILLSSCPTQRPTPTTKSMYSNNHTSCPQGMYKKQQMQRLYSSVVQGEPVRTQNRFSALHTLSEN